VTDESRAARPIKPDDHIAHPCGPALTDTGCRFRVWAPNASRVAVIGTFNEWRDDEHLLAAERDGIWETEVAGVRAGDQYLFVIDNRGGDEYNPGERGLRRIDPWARATRQSAGNAIVVDVAGELIASGLHDDPFVTPADAEWLVYQVHVGSFVGGGDGIDTGPSGTGTFAQFEHKLGYIRSLGFNVIALLPVQQNPGDGNEGYGPSHLFAPESSFGSPFDLRHLVRAAHDAGLAVLFDVVWNHLSDFDNRHWNFDGMTRDGGVFFEGGERSPWGPRLAFWKREVRDLIIANARMWFEEYHVDGLRIDAADEIAWDVLAAVVDVVRAEPAWRSKLLIAEWSGTNESSWDSLVDELGFDRVWSLADPYHFRAAMDDTGRDAAQRLEQLERVVDLPNAAARIRYLLGSHDDAHDNKNGARTGHRHFIELVGGRDDPHARAKARLGWALCVALPGTPMCFMGTECDQPGYWHPRTDDNPAHGDHRFDWSLCDDAVGSQMRALVAAANQARWDHPALRSGELALIDVDRDNGVLAFIRPATASGAVLVVVNASGTAWPDGGYRVPMPDNVSTWRVVLDSQAAEFGGEGLTHQDAVSSDGGISVTLPPWSLIMLVPVASGFRRELDG
jgi:1,4-alpha-glucan branching enzyme